MNRREAVQNIAFLLGGTLVGANAFLTGCKTSTGKQEAFTADDIAYLNEIADTILPTTASSPGAKAANVGQFMTVMVNDCYEAKDQKAFKEGMGKLNDFADKKYGSTFMKLNPQQRTDLLIALDKEADEYTKQQREEASKKKEDDKDKAKNRNVNGSKDDPPKHYFRLMKELTLLGYFTSEIGTTQARRYAPVPGKYDGCTPYKKGDKAWA